MRGRTGRRPGNPDTRQAILDAAAGEFARSGYGGATMRGIAAAAGVDTALLHHYWGSKNALFMAAVQAPIDPADIARRLAQGEISDLGRRLLSTLLEQWESPAGPALLALVRSALGDASTARMLREFVVSQVVVKLLRTYRVPDDEAALRGALVVSQVLGVITARYVVGVEPLASLPPEAVVAAVAPTLQRYIDGDVTGAGG
ncbi:TetR/AcrR family transcriptional regulator [Nakamurella endophytica]|uniref:TetR/AcrR family transcriptional regulator n=1 Tax=Nakamurella endophytica TaxID=1748367 RepID=UPI001663BDD1